MVRAHWRLPAVAALLCNSLLSAAEPASPPSLLPPPQFDQHSYYPAGSQLYNQRDAADVFRKSAFPPPQFLPPEAWEPEGHNTGVQPTQYPFEDKAARDFDPRGHGPQPAIGPDPLQVEGARGWTWKESAGTVTVLPGLDDQFGWSSFDLRAVGYFQQAPFVQFLPRFSWHLLDGPTTTDLPPRLYDFALDTLLYLPLNDEWSFLAMVGPGMFTDGDNTADAFRITGRALAFYQWNPAVKLSAGFLYLDRDDVKGLPAGGIIYTPHDDFKAEVIFPKPKIAWRTLLDTEESRWVYVAGEFGGNSWAIRRASGADDVISIRDLRLIAGWESIHTDGWHWLLEGGVAFARKLEYRSGLGDTDQDPTGLLRMGLVY